MASPASSSAPPSAPEITNEDLAAEVQTAYEGGSSALVRYEPMGAVPTRILKPRADESFTCYAFSADGNRLATGETNGTVTVWKTADYSELGVGSVESGVPVSALSFCNDASGTIVAVDKRGNFRKFLCPWRRSSMSTAAPGPLQETSSWKIKSDSADDGCHEAFLKYQFSQDGQKLAHFLENKHSATERFNFEGLNLYKLEDGVEPNKPIHVPWTSSDFELSIPSLSKNGGGLLVCHFRKEEKVRSTGIKQTNFRSRVMVLPRLEVESDKDPEFVRLPGERASWGLDGEYLLVWDTDEERPRLSIYRTSTIAHEGRAAKPFAQKTLRLGLSAWKAAMLKPQAPAQDIRVLVYEITKHQNKRLRRFFIWNTQETSVAKEVHMNMYQHRDFTGERLASAEERINELADHPLPAKSYEGFYYRMIGDVFPSFCCSDDGNWIGAFSWRRHGGAISSMQDGVTTWKFRLPNDLKFCPLFLPNQATFDPSQRHFVIFGSSAVLACKPSFLTDTVISPLRVQNLRQSDKPSRSESVESHSPDVWNVLSGAAVARKWKIHLKGAASSWEGVQQRVKEAKIMGRFSPFYHMADALSFRKSKDIVDASQSSDGSLAALIIQDSEQQPTCNLCMTRSGQRMLPEPSAALRFPMVLEDMEQPFMPSRVILFEGDEAATSSVVLFPRGQFPVTLFYDIDSGNWKVVTLEVMKCLDVSMTEDRKQVVILDVSRVCFLDLRQRRIEKEVKYEVSFERLLSAVHASMKWRVETNNDMEETSAERRLSDDGKSVLLAWDTVHERSIVVHPDTKESECEAQIQEADGQLSDFCVLSASGTSTSFVDLPELQNGKITIGIFNEQVRKVAFSFHIVENFPRRLSEKDTIMALSNVFYGVTNDGNQLVTVTTSLSQILPGQPAIEDKVRVFSIYGAENTIPTYDQLTLKRFQSVRQTFKRLHDEYGVSAFSAPSTEGPSILQKAFVERNEEMVKCIVEFADAHQCLLALEWKETTSEGERCNVLDKALETQIVGHIEDALGLVCSEVAPFGNAAVITKNSFEELVASSLEVVEKALAENLFVTHACDLDVHVKFMQPTSRLEGAEHICTANTFLDWRHTKDDNALKENWRKKNRSVVEKMESDGNKSTTPASLHFVRIEDAAKTGMNGIIRPLLLRNVPEHFFEFDAIKWIIQFKWAKIWRERFVVDACYYAIFLMVFTAYAILLSTIPEFSRGSFVNKMVTSCLLAVSAVFHIRILVKEKRQLENYMKDAKQYVKLPSGNRTVKTGKKDAPASSKWIGFEYYLRFAWNWLDLASCILLLTIITPLHVCSTVDAQTEEWLSAFVAIEVLVVYGKVWYFAQPFRSTGPLVRMISYIVWDCLPFLFLGLVIMMGFGVALPVMLRGRRVKENSDVVDNFGHTGKSLLTLFCALLGDFDKEIYTSAGNLSWLTILTFVLYLLAQTVLLLNLLISIMADTFDKVKSTEEAQLVMARARFIDACEAELTDLELKKIDDKIGKYLHVLLEKGEKFNKKGSAEWTGKLGRIEETIRNASQAIEEKCMSMMKRLVADHEREMQEQRNRITNLERIMEVAITDKLGKMERMLEKMSRKLEERTQADNDVKALTERTQRLLEKLESQGNTGPA